MERLVIEIPDSVEAPFTRVLAVAADRLELPVAEPRFPAPGMAQVYVEPVGNGYVVTGTLVIKAEMDCSRCLKTVVVEIDESFRVLLSGTPMEASPDDDLFLFDAETREFDIAPLMRELVLIGLPVKPLCRPECLGLCAECGGNRNTGSCRCEGQPSDPRWAELAALGKRLKLSNPSNSKENVSNGSTETESLEESQE
jgi:uncharacterized protein